MKKILFITNGHGEDLVAAEIIKKLGGKGDISVLPVVGKGKLFGSLNVKVLGPRKQLPGGGFSLRNFMFLTKDLYAGLAGNTLEQIGILRELQGSFDLVVAVGDLVPIIGALIVKAPFIFVGVNKSNYYKWPGYRYTPWEKLLLQKYALKVYVRDKITEQNLISRGIKIRSAEYVGNPLMDCIGENIRISEHQKEKNRKTEKQKNRSTIVIGFLPGTREDAKLNLEDFDRLAEELVRMKDPGTALKFITATNLNDIPEYIENIPFSEVLAQSDIIIGLSGTGNEQAAGSGIPVVSFYGRGSQYNQRFADAQKQLLGNALYLVRDRDAISVAAEVWNLLRHPVRMACMGKIGKERMGEPGAVEKIAGYIKSR